MDCKHPFGKLNGHRQCVLSAALVRRERRVGNRSAAERLASS
jgi:hypothetical protein